MNEETRNYIDSMIKTHRHNDGSAKKIKFTELEKLTDGSIPTVSGTAGASYTATEQQIINNLVSAVNLIISNIQK